MNEYPVIDIQEQMSLKGGGDDDAIQGGTGAGTEDDPRTLPEVVVYGSSGSPGRITSEEGLLIGTAMLNGARVGKLGGPWGMAAGAIIPGLIGVYGALKN